MGPSVSAAYPCNRNLYPAHDSQEQREDALRAVVQMREATGNGKNGYRDRKLETCVGTLALRVPKLRSGSFFPEDVIERYQRMDRAVVAAVAEMYRTGTSARKVQAMAERLGIARLSKDQVNSICGSPDALAYLDSPPRCIGSACAPTTRRGAPTARSSGTAASCRCSRRRSRWNAW
jgi:hypothetical protein